MKWLCARFCERKSEPDFLFFFQFSCFFILNLFLLFVHSEDLRTKNHGLALGKDTASKKFSSKFVFLTVKFALLYFDNGSELLPFAVYIIVLVCNIIWTQCSAARRLEAGVCK